MSTTGLSGLAAAPRIRRLGMGGVEIRLPRLVRSRGRGFAGLGQTELVRPGPTGGTEIVDPSGNVIYSESQVAANPSLLTSMSSSVCPDGTLPTWFPGGESICAGSTTSQGSTVVGPQYSEEVGGVCPVAGWCMTGSDPSDPGSYTWQGGGSPNVMNPAYALQAQSTTLPSQFTTQDTPAQQLAIQNETSGVAVPVGTMTFGGGSPVPAAVAPAAASNVAPAVVPVPAVVTPPAAPASSSASSGSGFDLGSMLSSPVNVFGLQIPAWGIGAAAIAAVLLLTSRGSK